jgi:predicted metal-dependent hydrolase
MTVRGIEVEVVRKDIRNLHVGVYPPDGRVRVATPLRLSDQAVRLAVVSRLGWIQRQRQGFEEQVRQSEREMVTGESHYYQGRRFLLDVIESGTAPRVKLANNTTLELRVRPGSDRAQRESVLHRWYRSRLQEALPALVSKWEPVVDVDVAEVRIKRMKTRWGTCSQEARRIWLNLELVRKPPTCLEYILVHEMVHLHERHHNERFRELMDRAMPNWRLIRDELNRSPLSHEDWSY